jgi:tetratricopeptide (TPR) repeat protein
MPIGIIESLDLIALVLISMVEGLSFPQPCAFQKPLTKFQTRPQTSQVLTTQHRFGNDLTLKLTDSGAFAAAGAVSKAPAAQKPKARTDPNYQIQKVEEWRMASVQHNPGKPDSAAMKVCTWDERDLELVIQWVTKLASQPVKTARRTLARASIRRVLQLTDQEVKRGDLNRILKQGALLHTDIALLGMATTGNTNASEPVAVFSDGRVGVLPKGRHWEFARRLIDAVSPSPSEDPMVRQWYIATTAHMQSRRLFAYARQNLENALEIFPSDYRILFYAGVLHETWASPLNQNILMPPGVQVTFGSKESELKRARSFFQKSIEANPNSAETHLRLGRVLGLLGDHRRAAAELEQAAASIGDRHLLYYASLYLGYEFEMLSRRSEARQQYERAATLYPAAQSPLLALSQLAHSSEDAKGALLALQRVYELPRSDLWKDDPWWVYDLSHVRDADELVTEMHKAFGGLSR